MSEGDTFAFYSALYGDYDEIKPAPRGEAYMYTDHQLDPLKPNGWVCRQANLGIATLLGKPERTGPMLAHKFWKMTAGRDEVDIACWMDASMTAQDWTLAAWVEDQLADNDLLLVRHPWRTCYAAEGEYSATLARYADEAPHILAQVEYYRSIGMPHDYGLAATGFHARRDTGNVRWLMNHWWQECITWSHQDQVSLPILLWLAEQEGHPLEISWVSWDDVYAQRVHLGMHRSVN